MLEQFEPRHTFPYLHGVYLAVNAIRDVRLLVDGPNCAFFKAEHVFGSHDIVSTLLDVEGRHRIANTDLDADRMVADHDERFLSVLKRLLEDPERLPVLVGALPMASITGIDYEALVDRVRVPGVPALVLPARSLDRGWLDGYADALAAVARGIELPAVAPDPGKVALVGHFMDRNEGDCRANVAELRRLVEAVGLGVASVWLDGGGWADLAAAASAGVVVALPHAREAARVLAKRTGAPLVEAPVPFGVEATDDFVRAVARASGREAAGEAVVDAGHSRVARAWEWLIPRRFQFRKVAFLGDPLMMPGFCRMVTGLGAEVSLLVACSKAREGFGPGGAEAAHLPVEPRWEPRGADGRVCGDVDLVVGNSQALREAGGVRSVEFGFPSRGHHCFAPAPFLGYEGALFFVDRMSDALGDRMSLPDGG